MDIFGYLDPTTGSLFIQVLIGGLLAGTVVLRNVIRNGIDRIKTTLLRLKPADEA